MRNRKRERIEKLIGRRWWLGHKLWESIYNMRGDFDPNFYRFYRTLSLRVFNINRAKRGFKLVSPISRKKQFAKVYKRR